MSDDRYAAAVEAARARVADRLSAINADIAEYKELQEALSGGSPEGPTKTQPEAAIAAQWDAADTGKRAA